MNDDKKYPSERAERFQVRLPPGLRDRIKAYAERHGRSMNTEIVRVLENQFPEPWTLDRRISELLDMVEVLRSAASEEAVARLMHELEETIEGLAAGRFADLDAEMRDRIAGSIQLWREEQAKYAWADEPELDKEELEALERIGATSKFVHLDDPFPDPEKDDAEDDQ